jgi:methyltransferase (TIGR00027 family)
MRDARPSATAYRVAIRRAQHQVIDDDPKVLDDPMALPIIGGEAAARLKDESDGRQGRFARAVRAFMVARSRYAEDELARAVARGATQYVILGAGLDTFAYRNPYAAGALRVFEVDHPATQEWKRGRVAAAGIAATGSVTYAPVDFEKQALPEGLARAGFQADAITFFSWLGVTMYLEPAAIKATLGYIASTPRGGGVALDYAVPRSSLSWMGRIALDVMSRRVARSGEPLRTFFDPRELVAQMRAIGFSSVEDLGKEEINARYFKNRADGLEVVGSLGRVMTARL